MRNIRLEVNNVSVDLEKDTNIQLNKYVGASDDITYIGGDFTYSFKLPLTDRNKLIFDNVQLIEGKQGNFYSAKEYIAKFYVNDVLLIQGPVLIDRINKNEGTIQVNILSDNISWVQKIGNKNLQELQSFPAVNYTIDYLFQNSKDLISEFTGNTNSFTHNQKYPVCFPLISYGNYYSPGPTFEVGGELYELQKSHAHLFSYLDITDYQIQVTNNYTTRYDYTQLPPAFYFTNLINYIFADAGYKIAPTKLWNDNNINKLIIPYTNENAPEFPVSFSSRLNVISSTFSVEENTNKRAGLDSFLFGSPSVINIFSANTANFNSQTSTYLVPKDGNYSFSIIDETGSSALIKGETRAYIDTTDDTSSYSQIKFSWKIISKLGGFIDPILTTGGTPIIAATGWLPRQSNPRSAGRFFYTVSNISSATGILPLEKDDEIAIAAFIMLNDGTNQWRYWRNVNIRDIDSSDQGVIRLPFPMQASVYAFRYIINPINQSILTTKNLPNIQQIELIKSFAALFNVKIIIDENDKRVYFNRWEDYYELKETSLNLTEKCDINEAIIKRTAISNINFNYTNDDSDYLLSVKYPQDKIKESTGATFFNRIDIQSTNLYRSISNPRSEKNITNLFSPTKNRQYYLLRNVTNPVISGFVTVNNGDPYNAYIFGKSAITYNLASFITIPTIGDEESIASPLSDDYEFETSITLSNSTYVDWKFNYTPRLLQLVAPYDFARADYSPVEKIHAGVNLFSSTNFSGFTLEVGDINQSERFSFWPRASFDTLTGTSFNLSAGNLNLYSNNSTTPNITNIEPGLFHTNYGKYIDELEKSYELELNVMLDYTDFARLRNNTLIKIKGEYYRLLEIQGFNLTKSTPTKIKIQKVTF